jgi:hypothetical protein
MIDLISYLRRIQNKDVNETFDPGTDSLEALRDWLAAVLGVGPGVGLWMFGVCDPAMVASQTTIVTNNLAGLPNDIFNNEFWMQVIHNASAPGTAPEREIRRITDFVGATQTFTVDGFSANVEANDLVCIFHESILPTEILGFGTLTVSSTTVPRDGARTEGDNYFNGCLLMTTEGAARFQPRRIVDYDGTGAPGTFTLDPNNPLTVAPGFVDYVIIGGQVEFAPAANGTNNRTPADVVGSKASTAIYAKNDTSDIIRYLKGLLDVSVIAFGTLDTSSATLPADSTRLGLYAWENNDYFKGCLLMPVAGNCRFQPRPIRSYVAATGIFTLDEPFSQAPGLVAYIILNAGYPTQRLIDMFSIVNALLLDAETGGTLTADGTEQTIYINNTPAGIFEPLIVNIDCTNMAAGDSTVLRAYYRITAGGNLIKKDEITLNGAQNPALKNITLEPNRYGVRVTLQQTGITNRDYNWEAITRI